MIKSTKYYTVVIDGQEYHTTGTSREQIKERYNVPLDAVKLGTDLVNVPAAPEPETEPPQ